MNIKIPDNISSVFSKIEGNNRYYAFVGILIFVFLMDYFLLMSPQLSALRKISPEIKILAENIKKAKEDIEKLNLYKTNLEQASEKFDQANLRVTSRDEISVVLEYIAFMANETGIKIDQIVPDMLEQDLLAENDQRKYYDLPVYIEARGSYHNFGLFLNKVEQNDISLRVGTFTMVVTDDMRHHAIKMTFKTTIFEDIQS